MRCCLKLVLVTSKIQRHTDSQLSNIVLVIPKVPSFVGNWNLKLEDCDTQWLQVKLKSSVEVRKDWELQVEIEFSQIAKKYLSYPEKDITNLVECGTLEHYDKRFVRPDVDYWSSRHVWWNVLIIKSRFDVTVFLVAITYCNLILNYWYYIFWMK